MSRIAPFVKPKANDLTTTWNWTIQHAFESPAGIFARNYVTLTSEHTPEVYALCKGFLSTRPPEQISYANGLLDDTVGDGVNLIPEAINIYLYFNPLVRTDQRFVEENSYGINYAYYGNIDTRSLVTALGEEAVKNAVLFQDAALTVEDVLYRFVIGNLQIPVDKGQHFGDAYRAEPGARATLKFSVLNEEGPLDPAWFYASVNSLIDPAAQADIMAEFLQPATDPGTDLADMIRRSGQEILPFGTLRSVKDRWQPTFLEWRTIGNQQKALYLAGLKSRAGIPTNAADPKPHFNFDELDRYNLFQLEAIVEFYANFSEPMTQAAYPATDATDYIHINLLPLYGVRARFIEPTVLQIEDADIDLNLLLTRDQIGQTSGIYPWQQPLLEVFDANDNFLQALRIESVDIAASTLTVVAGDAATSDPALHGDTVLRWKVTQRPTLVLVDPLNSRLGNQKATIVGTYDEDKTILELDCKLGDLKVNKDCDTIYLAADTNRASKRYRIIRGAYGTQSDNAKKRNHYDHSVGTNPSTDGAITQLGNGKKRILVAGLPAFAEGTTESPWNIPAGLGGEINHPGKDYYSKKLTLGYDTTDGWMFVVYDGRVRLMQKWTSYTSRSHGLGSEQNSSIAGNKLYHYYSHRSGKKRTINYSLKVVDKPLTD